jgi:DNA-binding NtrC family response regulator
MSFTSILIVDDDEDILTAGRLLLKQHYDPVHVTSDPRQIPTLMQGHDYQVILLDMNFSPGASTGEAGFHWLDQILEQDPEAVVVLITAHGGVETAVEAMKRGATDFVAKPWENGKLLATLSSAAKLRESRLEARRLKAANQVLTEAASPTNQQMLGSSNALRTVQRMIERAAPTDANVLLLGENGTGKELAARSLHSQSRRAAAPFISVDLGAITETLFESELFGHVKGAFTDARKASPGRILAADGGTLFLDEVGNLPLHLQAKLLSVLEQREVVPVGGSKPVPVDVRVIAATNVSRDLLDDESRFRQDLLFRLNTVEITLPPLRERRSDILTIAEHYADQYARKYDRPSRAFTPEVDRALSEYDWPGNIRALRHAVERAVILADGDTFQVQDFPLGAQGISRDSSPPEAFTELNLENIEKHAIQRALSRNRYNISHAARDLGLTRAALYRRMEKHGL